MPIYIGCVCYAPILLNKYATYVGKGRWYFEGDRGSEEQLKHPGKNNPGCKACKKNILCTKK
jgi:hypothetical protein